MTRLEELHKAWENRHNPIQYWQNTHDESPSNDRIVCTQVWKINKDKSITKSFGIRLRCRDVDDCIQWYTEDNKLFTGWVAFWKDF